MSILSHLRLGSRWYTLVTGILCALSCSVTCPKAFDCAYGQTADRTVVTGGNAFNLSGGQA